MDDGEHKKLGRELKRLLTRCVSVVKFLAPCFAVHRSPFVVHLGSWTPELLPSAFRRSPFAVAGRSYIALTINTTPNLNDSDL